MIASPSSRMSGLFYSGGQGVVVFLGAGYLLVLYSPDAAYGALGYASAYGGTQFKFYANGANYIPPARKLLSLPTTPTAGLTIVDSPADDDNSTLPTAQELQEYATKALSDPEALSKELKAIQATSDPGYVYAGEGFDSCSICPYPETPGAVSGPSEQTCARQSEEGGSCSEIATLDNDHQKALLWAASDVGSYIIKGVITVDSQPTDSCDGISCKARDDSTAIKQWFQTQLNIAGAHGVKVSVDSAVVDPIFDYIAEYLQPPKRLLQETKGLVSDYHVCEAS